MALTDTDIARICGRGFQWAKAAEYLGWEKHDALNSSLLKAMSMELKWPRILAIQSVMRFPINLRPLLGVRKHRNPKGISLFARARLNLNGVTGEAGHLEEACTLLDWLLENPSGDGWPGLSWGYPYPWQDPGFYAPSGFPNRIVTCFAGRALVHGYEVTGSERYIEGAREAVEFILKAPKVLHEGPDSKCLSYIPADDIAMAVMDVSALCGALCAMVGKHTGDGEILAQARRLIKWVADKQTDYGAWFYTWPSSDSHIKHDNYHTGEILDALLEYRKYSGDEDFDDVYARGLAYYRENLFTPDARPKWMNDRQFPYDSHGYSQGIITFTLAGELSFARSLAAAAVEDLWDEKDGRFYYRRTKRRTMRVTFMRWCQGWLTFALSTLLAAGAGEPSDTTNTTILEKNHE